MFKEETELEEKMGFIEPCAEIVRRTVCSKCKNQIDEQSIEYACLFCSHSHCEEYEQQSSDAQGTNSLAHQHILYKIHPSAQQLDKARWGRNIFKEPKYSSEKPQIKKHHGVGCDNDGVYEKCKSVVEGVRYKCAHCLDFDFCSNCEEA